METIFTCDALGKSVKVSGDFHATGYVCPFLAIHGLEEDSYRTFFAFMRH
ncbi:hypothetical protein [Paenibacillus sp. OAS669]|nr:hypothetical protein [Paenibacillus sp. OAS669]MBE1443561.1 hypothetical protein [Paenibacillus sp. OAS669]